MPKDAKRKLIKGVNDLQVTNPEVASEAYGWDPSTVTPGMGQKRNWQCKFGHIWEARIQNRVRGIGCPVCSNQLIIPEINSLLALYPEVASEAYDWNPAEFGAGSMTKKTWKCNEGHIYKLAIAIKVSGAGCQVCSGKQVEFGFNDLFTKEPQMSLEADGWEPSKTYFKTTQRKNWKCSKGHTWSVSVRSRVTYRSSCPSCSGLRVIKNETDLLTKRPEIASQAYGWDPSLVKPGSMKIMKWKCSEGHIYEASINSRTRIDQNRGCPYCSGRRILAGFNDLATTHPELALFANGWDPSQVSMGQTKPLNWKCDKGHEWKQSPNHVVKHKIYCPKCEAQTQKHHGRTLLEVFPELASQSYGWDPNMIGVGSAKPLMWQCSLGHLWSATLGNRISKKSGCPICAGQKVWPGFNDLLTLYPDLASQAYDWDPSQVLAGGSGRRKWVCEDGHIWSTGISNRLRGTGCPSCAKFGFDPNKEAVLYFMKHDEWSMYQIGITNSPKTRIKLHEQRGWEFIESWGPADGLLIKGWEQSILTYLRTNGAHMASDESNIKFDGYTEAWLMNSFPRTTLKDLMENSRDL